MKIQIKKRVIAKNPSPSEPSNPPNQEPAWQVMDRLIQKLGGAKSVASKLRIAYSTVNRWGRDNGGGIRQRKVMHAWHNLLKENGLEDQNPHKP